MVCEEYLVSDAHSSQVALDRSSPETAGFVKELVPGAGVSGSVDPFEPATLRSLFARWAGRRAPPVHIYSRKLLASTSTRLSYPGNESATESLI